jgi:hypothetical protein
MLTLMGAACNISSAEKVFPDSTQLPAQNTLPDPLVMLDGTRVTTAKQWTEQRRPELRAIFQHYMYGQLPPRPAKLDFHTDVVDPKFLDGQATLKLVTISIPGRATPRIDLLVVTPNAVKQAPVFLALNFCGNHTVHADPRIPLAHGYLGSGCKGCTDGRPTEAARGTQAGDWPLEEIIRRGYALATFCNADVDSDRADVSDGVYAWLAELQGGSTATAPTKDRGCIAGWAWGFQRCVDYLVTDRAVDAKRIVAVGHSRNGKTALLAAAFDDRIALAIPHQAGCGGTAPNRASAAARTLQANGRPFSETMAVINKNFPHWFNAEYKKFNATPEKLPFDQNCLVALMAPRPVLLSNALDDQWADPSGQFDVLKGAEPVYQLLRAGGCDAAVMPPVNQLVNSKLGYYIRQGKHSMIGHDWRIFMEFADKQLGQR